MLLGGKNVLAPSLRKTTSKVNPLSTSRWRCGRTGARGDGYNGSNKYLYIYIQKKKAKLLKGNLYFRIPTSVDGIFITMSNVIIVQSYLLR